jgi:hypothetical protein
VAISRVRKDELPEKINKNKYGGLLQKLIRKKSPALG